MIVAARASNRQAEKGFAQNIDAVINAVSFVLTDIYRAVDFLSKKEKACAKDRLIETVFGVKSWFVQ